MGVVGLVLGAVFGAKAKNKQSQVDDAAPGVYCKPGDSSLCNQDGLNLLKEGRTAATISNIGFIGGGVLLAGGIVIMATSSLGSGAPADAKSGQARLELVPLAGPSLNGVILRGAW